MKKELLIKNFYNFYIPFWNNIYEPILYYLSKDDESGDYNEELLPYAFGVASIVCGMIEAVLVDTYINGKTLTINDKSNLNRKLDKISNIDMNNIKLNIGMFDCCDNMINTYTTINQTGDISRILIPEDPHDTLLCIKLDSQTASDIDVDIEYCYSDNIPNKQFANAISVYLSKNGIKDGPLVTSTLFDEYSFEEFDSMFTAITVLQKAAEIGFVEAIENLSIQDQDNSKFDEFIGIVGDYVINKNDLVDEDQYNGSDTKYELKQSMIATTVTMSLIMHHASSNDTSSDDKDDKSPDGDIRSIINDRSSVHVTNHHNLDTMIDNTIEYLENMNIIVDGKVQDHLVVTDEVRKDMKKIFEFYMNNQDSSVEKASLSISKFTGIPMDEYDKNSKTKAQYVLPCMIMTKMSINEDDETYSVEPIRFDDIDPAIRAEGSRLREWLRSELIRRGVSEEILDGIEEWSIKDVEGIRFTEKDKDDDAECSDKPYSILGPLKPDEVVDNRNQHIYPDEYHMAFDSSIGFAINPRDPSKSNVIYEQPVDDKDLIDLDKSSVNDNYIESLEILSDEIYKNYFCNQLKNWYPIGAGYPRKNIAIHKELTKAIDDFLKRPYGTMLKLQLPNFDMSSNMSFIILIRYGNTPLTNIAFEYDEDKRKWNYGLFLETGQYLKEILSKNKKEKGLWFMIVSKLGYFAEELDYLNMDVDYLRKCLHGWDLARHIVLAFRMAIDLKLIRAKNELIQSSEDSDSDSAKPIRIATKWNFGAVLDNLEQMVADMSDDERKSFIKLFRKCNEFYRSKSKEIKLFDYKKKPHTVESPKIQMHLPGNGVGCIRDIAVAKNNRAVIDNTRRIYDDKSFYVRTNTGWTFIVERVVDMTDEELITNMDKMINYIEYQYNHPEEEEVL